MSEGLTVVVMAYDEVGSLADVVHRIREELESLGRAWEIVIVNDGSGDGTGEVADALASEHGGIRAAHHEGNLGLGAVYRTGFSEARQDWVTFLPGDGQIPASSIQEFVVPMVAGADLVLGTIPDRPVPFFVKALSGAERLLYRLLFGRFPDFQGMVMFRRSLLDEIPLTSTGRGWTVLMEFILRAVHRGVVIAHAETGLDPRRAGVSKVTNLPTILSNLRQVFALRLQLWRSADPGGS